MAAGREAHDARAEFVGAPLDRVGRIVANDDVNTAVVAGSPEGGDGASTEMLNVLGPPGDRDRVHGGVEASGQGVCGRQGRLGELRPVQGDKDVSVPQARPEAFRGFHGSTALRRGAQDCVIVGAETGLSLADAAPFIGLVHGVPAAVGLRSAERQASALTTTRAWAAVAARGVLHRFGAPRRRRRRPR
jgi:hypothetical protein